MIRTVLIPLVVGLVLTCLLTWRIIPALRRLAGQNIREEGPEAHQKKAGTPSMGGIAIIIGALIGFVAGWRFSIDGLVIMAGMLMFGAIGFFDDYLKVVKKQNEGLKPGQKFGLQMLGAAVIAVYMAFFSSKGTFVYIPFADKTVDFGPVLYIIFIMFTILAMVNAVNLTDGLDGLAAGVTAIVSAFLIFLAIQMNETAPTVAMSGLLGACIGFLVFNHHPAKVFMGDTGSLALGGAITAAAIVMRMELLLPIVGLIYVLEVVSVILQVLYFKKTHGKRLFKMTPLHHHFELSGMKETSVVTMFWIVTAVMCVIGVLIVR